MSWLARIVGGGIGEIVKQVGDVVDEFHLSGEEKQRFMLKLEGLIQQRDAQVEETMRTELHARARVLTAELGQGDAYTKRARPTVVYAGLLFIFLNYCLVPTIQQLANAPITPFELPAGFWAGWSGIVGTWAIGRSMEKMGAHNRFSQMVTGNRGPSFFEREIGAVG
jgi:hypothetical protein